METLEWNYALATGIRKIDQQHKHLLEIINQVRAAIEHGDSDAAGVALQHMRDYTVYHFSFEEKLLEKAGFPALPLHRRVHQLFVKRIPQFQRRYAAGENVLEDMHHMLTHWLVHHIQSDDRDYVPYVKDYLRERKKRREQAKALASQEQPLSAPAAASEPAAEPVAPTTQEAAPAAEEEDKEPQGKRSLWGKLSDFMTGDF